MRPAGARAEKAQLHQHRGADNLRPLLFDKVYCGLQRAAGRQYVINDDHARCDRKRIDVDLQPIAAVLQSVVE